jgi:hypothetical protein
MSLSDREIIGRNAEQTAELKIKVCVVWTCRTPG